MAVAWIQIRITKMEKTFAKGWERLAHTQGQDKLGQMDSIGWEDARFKFPKTKTKNEDANGENIETAVTLQVDSFFSINTHLIYSHTCTSVGPGA